MPRGKKKKAVVLFGPEGNIIGHAYLNNHRNIEKGKPFRLKYDPRTRKRVEIKVKDERHAT